MNEYEDQHALRKNSSLVMSRDRSDSINAFKKFDKGNGLMNGDGEEFDSPNISPMLSSSVIPTMPYLNFGSNQIGLAN